MATIASLRVNLRADTKAFQRGLRKATKRIRKFAAAVAATSLRIAKFGVAAGAAAVGGISVLVARAMPAIDAMGKLAARTGESTEALIGLQHAAELTGAGKEKLAAAMDVMQKRLGEAARGTGAAKAALDELGLSADTLIGMSPAEQFKTIADAISRLQTSSQRAAATANIFSRANQDLVNMLALGRSGLQSMSDEAAALGLTFSRIDAAKVEAANDAFYKLRAAIGGVTTQLAVQLAPYIESAANWFVELARAGNESGNWMQDALRTTGLLLADFLDGVQQTRIAILDMGLAMMKAAQWATQAWPTVMRMFADTGTGLGAVLNALGLGGGVATATGGALKGLAAAYEFAMDDALMKANMRLAEAMTAGSWGDALMAGIERINQEAFAGAVRVVDVQRRALDEQIDGVKQLSATIGNVGLAGAAERGTQAAYSAVARAGRDAEQQQLKIAGEQLREAHRTRLKIEELVRLLQLPGDLML